MNYQNKDINTELYEAKIRAKFPQMLSWWINLLLQFTYLITKKYNRLAKNNHLMLCHLKVIFQELIMLKCHTTLKN